MSDQFGQYAEVQATQPFVHQNSKLLKVTLQGNQVKSKLGAMVAYQGDVKFERASSGGMGKIMKKALTGETATFMDCTGSGEVFFADTAKSIHILYLNNEQLTVNGQAILAFDASMQWDIKMVKGAGIAAGGLFNVVLSGSGYVALTSDGDPVKLDIGSAPTFVDPQAAVAWSATAQTSVKTDVSIKTFIGRGSGESFQLAFPPSGPHAWVLVQPSEGPQIPAA